MPQNKFAAGTLLKGPQGKTIKVTDPNQFFSEQFAVTKTPQTFFGAGMQSKIANNAAKNTLSQAFMGMGFNDLVDRPPKGFNIDLESLKTVGDLEAKFRSERERLGITLPIKQLPDFPTTTFDEKKIGEISPPKDATQPFEPPEPTAPTETEAFVTGVSEDVANQRKTVEDIHKRAQETAKTERESIQKEIDAITSKEEGALGEIEALTQPFREKLEKSERERLKIEENFFANQKSIGELETLLTQGTAEIEALKAQTGLAVIRNPRINKRINDLNARVGVIQAVMAARNGQINVAEGFIDRTSAAINADRRDQLAYYDSVLNYYSGLKDDKGKEVISLKKDEKDALEAQTNLIENDLAQAEEVANVIKGMMISDPSRVEGSGITLNDDLETISKKLSDHDFRQEWTEMKNTMELDEFTHLTTPEEVERMRKAGRKVVAVKDSRGTDNFFVAPLAKSSPISPTQNAKERESEMNAELGSVVGDDNFVSPEDYKEAKRQWIQAKGNPTVFDTKFKGFRNPENPNYFN